MLVRASASRFPDFIIIGAMRAGTTTLADQLSRHPEIGMSNLKETDFFIEEKNFGRGVHWYWSLFPGGKRLLGEASPNYTKNDVFKGVPARIRKTCPAVKLIYMVRDPVDRFWSHYTHSHLVCGRLPSPQEIVDDPEGAHILASSMYFKQLDDYLQVFPPDQVQIVDLADLQTDASRTFAAVLRFIGADQQESLPAKPRNSAAALAETPGWALRISQHPALVGLRARTPRPLRGALRAMLRGAAGRLRTAPPIPAAARKRVAEALADDVAQFRSLTGRKFSTWSI